MHSFWTQKRDLEYTEHHIFVWDTGWAYKSFVQVHRWSVG